MKQLSLLLCIIISTITTVSIAEDTYTPNSGVLFMPVVNVGNESYEVNMIHKGNLVFEVTSAKIIIELSDFYGVWIGPANLTINPDGTLLEVNIPTVASYQLNGHWEVVNANEIKLFFTDFNPTQVGYLKLTSSSVGIYNGNSEEGNEHEVIKQ